MRAINPELTTELLEHFKDKSKVPNQKAFKVKSFRQLVEITARLSYLNKDWLLFYRGQAKDYQNRNGGSSFYPSIYRKDHLQQREVLYQFDLLEGACKSLVDLFKEKSIVGYEELKKRKYIQWSILQHYEVCDTPLLDFTQSLRVACSFALQDNMENHAYVYVFGLPYLSNRISINSEYDIVNVRLLSICPPTALRPYFQEGYLVGTPDITNNYDSKSELDFNNRLIAKFEIPNTPSFWGDGFEIIPKNSLYPKNDPIESLCTLLKESTDRELRAGTMGDFLKEWAEIEERLIHRSADFTYRRTSVREAIRVLFEQDKISQDNLYRFETLRKFRNIVVHSPKTVDEFEAQKYLLMLNELKNQIQV